ncbi:hypothetical protein ACF0H5_020010 [Mactra antiquata]
MRTFGFAFLVVFVLSVIWIQESEGKKGNKCKCRVQCRSKEEAAELSELNCGNGKNGEEMIECCKKPKGLKKPKSPKKEKKPKEPKVPTCDCKKKCSSKEKENGECVGGQKYCCKNWDF